MDPAAAACKVFRYAYQGHGRGMYNLGERLKSFLRKAPKRIARFEIDENSCSTFSCLKDSEDSLRSLIPVLGTSREMKVSANLCQADNVECQPRYLFRLDQNRIAGAPGPCLRNGSYCYDHDTRVACQKDGRVTSELCCCNDKDKIHDFDGPQDCHWYFERSHCP